jgi:hypothetical protein
VQVYESKMVSKYASVAASARNEGTTRLSCPRPVALPVPLLNVPILWGRLARSSHKHVPRLSRYFEVHVTCYTVAGICTAGSLSNNLA